MLGNGYYAARPEANASNSATVRFYAKMDKGEAPAIVITGA
jgi:hypothetical protein